MRGRTCSSGDGCVWTTGRSTSVEHTARCGMTTVTGRHGQECRQPYIPRPDNRPKLDLLLEPPEGNSHVPVPASTALTLTVSGGHCPWAGRAQPTPV